MLLRRQALAAVLGIVGIATLGLVAALGGWLTTPVPAAYLLVLALLTTAVEHERLALQRERKLTREREMAEALSRAKTELLAHVSHEMRTPMNAVLGFSDILARTPLQPEQERYVDLLGHPGRQVFDLINDLLDNARIESGRLELARHAFNLVDVVELQVELLRARAQAQGLWLRVFVRSPDVGWVLGDAKRVAQIVTNLVGNAIKFTAKGGVIVEMSREPGEMVVIAVQDTGIGIAPESLERIFKPFEQADAGVGQQFGGSGLGLSITRSLAQLMGGDASVRSTPGEGSRFEGRLNLAATEPPHAGEDGPIQSITPSRPLNLLLAEDNDVNVLVIEGMLMPLGHRHTPACTGREAIEAMRREAFDLVLMDMLMPEMDGLAATRQWRAIEATEDRPRTPIVALTANAYDSDMQRSLEAGCDPHLTKPISQTALHQALARYTRR